MNPWPEIVSVRGRIWTRIMTLNYATRMWRGVVSRTELAAVLDDATWCQPFGGCVPAFIARSAGLEAIMRRGRLTSATT